MDTEQRAPRQWKNAASVKYKDARGLFGATGRGAEGRNRAIRPPPSGLPDLQFRPCGLLADIIMRLIRHDTANATAGGGVIARSPRNQVGMTMEHRLPRIRAIIKPKIESGNPSILFHQHLRLIFRQHVHIRPFLRSQIAERSNVPPWNNQRMPDTHRISIAERDTPLRLRNNFFFV